MSQASFYRKPQVKVVKYLPKHRWVCLNLIMETAVKHIEIGDLIDFDINSEIGILIGGTADFDVPLINLVIGKIHKKLRIIIDKRSVLSLWKIALIVFKYQYNLTSANRMKESLGWEFNLKSCQAEYQEHLSQCEEYKTMLTKLGFKIEYIPGYVISKFVRGNF